MAARTDVPSRLAIVDRDARYAEWLRHHLGVLCPDASVTVIALTQFEQWIDEKAELGCDVLMLASSFGSSPEDPQAHGLELLRLIRERPRFPAIIAVAEDGNELTAVRALQLGAVDYLPKRLLTPDRLKTSVLLALRRIERRVASRIAELAEERAGGARSAASVAEGKPPENEASPVDGEARSAAPASGNSSAAPAAESAAAGPFGDNMPPDFIPGYTIHATIGESEKAAVYVASSTQRGHNVAIKVSKTLRDEAAGRQFLEREYTAILAVRDPCVVQIYDYGIHAGYEYLVMEYLPQGDLKARMQKGLNEQEALGYVEQIAAALQVVHQAGLLHRDLKPPNVMLREDGHIALIDFGLARALDGSTPSTRIGVLRGSPYYMSPEQALGEPLDARSDFYSLGIIYYEMLTSRKPYTGSSAMEVLQQHVNAPVPQLPRAFAHNEPLLSRLLAKAREDRFASAAEILSAITTLRAGAEAQSSAA